MAEVTHRAALVIMAVGVAMVTGGRGEDGGEHGPLLPKPPQVFQRYHEVVAWGVSQADYFKSYSRKNLRLNDLNMTEFNGDKIL